MEREEVVRRLRELCSTVLSVPEEAVTPQARLVADLGADSLDFAELEVAVQDAFGVAVDRGGRWGRVSTVADVADLLLARQMPDGAAEVPA
ncbi:acyl carrier protein [Streptomyces sp. NPDC013178]|uniref:acyl carrier protein n=1 Tax=unclassified Streptomyces TaxID=2593676 RepID=UPI0033E45AA6